MLMSMSPSKSTTGIVGAVGEEMLWLYVDWEGGARGRMAKTMAYEEGRGNLIFEY